MVKPPIPSYDLNPKERVRAVHYGYLDTLYAIKVYQFSRDRIKSRNSHLDVLIGICSVLGGASGLGAALKSDGFGWIALIAGALATLLAIVRTSYANPKLIEEANQHLILYVPISILYNQLIIDLNAYRSWDDAMEVRYNEIRTLEQKDTKPNPFSPLKLPTRNRLQDEVESENRYKTWWRPYDEPDESEGPAA